MRRLDPAAEPPAPAVEPSPPGSERRRHPRIETAARCLITGDQHAVYLRVHDVSEGGLSVRAPVPLSPRERVEVTLELPGGGRARARGEVVWVHEASGPQGGPRMGARFLELVEGAEALYEALGRGVEV